MDEVYVMRHERHNGGRLSHRRCHAEQQWLQIRADADYEAACAVVDRHKADYIAFFTVQLRSLAPRLRVTTGSALFHTNLRIWPANVRLHDLPLCLTKDENTLTRSIIHVDREALMHVLVSFDPLAWMCCKHLERHQWFLFQMSRGTPQDLQPTTQERESFFYCRDHACVRQTISSSIQSKKKGRLISNRFSTITRSTITSL